MDRLTFSFLFTIILFTACYVDDESVAYTNFDAPLHTYLEKFEQIALSRGLTLDIASLDIKGRIEEIVDEGVAGTCTYNSQNPNTIIVDRSFWESATNDWREYVVFHELGHCVLGRGHREDMDIFGNCISIMQSGRSGCYVAYLRETKEQHFDELFLPHLFD